MSEDNSTIKTLLITTGYSCNNKCLMCSVDERRCAFPDRYMDDIESDLKDGRLRDFTELEFTGGEPTARKDIIDLVARAKKLGYERISLSTNGRLFNYEDFCQKIIAAGLNKATVSLHGHNEKIHNAITRTPDSFQETIAGIKNLQKFSNFHLNISTVVSSPNYQHLSEISELVLSLGIKNWYLLDLIPEGAAKDNYMSLAVTQKELSRVLNGLNPIAEKFNELGFFDFPFCLFSPEMIANKKINYINTQKRGETTEQVGFSPERIVKDERGLYSDELRRQVEVCGKCLFQEKCGGVWREYLDKFGEEETVELMKRNGCEINN